MLIGYFILQLEVVNKNLEAYYDAWDKFVEAWIIIKIKDPSCVYQWRLQVTLYKIPMYFSMVSCLDHFLFLFRPFLFKASLMNFRQRWP